jgi:predicted lactoylglutathione lyase
MPTKVFVNLPVKDLNKSKAFFEGLGFSFNPQFTDENAACMVISDTIYSMLLMESYFKTFTNKAISDATKSTETIITLDASSREEVSRIVAKAKELGGTIYREPQDHGWMYQHSFADLDGHQWEFVYMDETQLPS